MHRATDLAVLANVKGSVSVALEKVRAQTKRYSIRLKLSNVNNYKIQNLLVLT